MHLPLLKPTLLFQEEEWPLISDILTSLLCQTAFDLPDNWLHHSKNGLPLPKEARAKVKEQLLRFKHHKGFEKLIDFLYVMKIFVNGASSLHTTSLPKSSSAGVYRINKVKQYVEENYGSPIRMSEAATLVALSEAAFSRFFKKHTGVCFSAYVNEVRIREASRLLCETSSSVVEIAYCTGFSTPCYFNWVFKRSMGITPGRFRVGERGECG